MDNKKDNITQVDFGTTKPNITETTQEQEQINAEFETMCSVIGHNVLLWATYATKEEYMNHMIELYDNLRPEETNQSKIITPNKEIILPN